MIFQKPSVNKQLTTFLAKPNLMSFTRPLLLLTAILAFTASSLALAEPTPINKKAIDDFVNYGPQCLQPIEAEYTTKMFGMTITSHTRQEKAGENFLFSMHAESLFSEITESTRFNYSRNRIQPVEYRYKRTGLGKDKNIRLDFLWNKERADYSYNDDSYSTEIRNFKIFQDKLSYQRQLCFELKKDINADDITFHIPYKNRKKLVVWENKGIEEIKTELGIIRAVKLSKVRDDDDRSTTIWLAIDHQFLLVKLYQEEDDEDYDLDISKASINGQSI